VLRKLGLLMLHLDNRDGHGFKGTIWDVSGPFGMELKTQTMSYAAKILEVITSFRHGSFFSEQSNIPLQIIFPKQKAVSTGQPM
jgi:hypothetical protein